MKSTIKLTGPFLIMLALLISCSNDETPTETAIRATPEAFLNLKRAALEEKVQEFEFDTNQMGFFTTADGVRLVIDGSCLTESGNPVTGTVNVQVVELFERGGMLTTNKPTMGTMPNGGKALLISGGEFFINVTQNGNQLAMECPMQLIVPADLTDGGDNQMSLFCGNGWDNDCDGIDDDCDGFVWGEVTDPDQGQVGLVDGDTGETYVASFLSFGWTNVDRFYTDPRPKSTLLVDVPDGFDNTNSSVFISFNGEPNALGTLDTFITETELFSEHYGQIPIGLECHIIFVSETDGNWLYAIKSVTIADGETISILEGDLGTASIGTLETLINNLP